MFAGEGIVIDHEYLDFPASASKSLFDIAPTREIF
jgi:hypothetical protein